MSNWKYRLATNYLIKFTDITNLSLGSVFCPFHPNMNTKAGHLYLDNDGVERLYCYVCNRQYTSSDYLYQIVGIKDFRKYLLEKFTEEEIDKAYEKMLMRKQDSEEVMLEFKDNPEEFFKQLYLGDYYVRK